MSSNSKGHVLLQVVGDGIDDAPVLAISDVGVAMAGLGSDATIETADVVIQTDQPSKIVTAINNGKATNNIVWQNIAFAFGVKIIVGVGCLGRLNVGGCFCRCGRRTFRNSKRSKNSKNEVFLDMPFFKNGRANRFISYSHSIDK